MAVIGIIILNTLVFLYINHYPGSSMSNYFLTAYGITPMNFYQPWIWFTSMFLHANLIHIGFNMFALYDLGTRVEKAYNSLTFLIVYFISGLFSYLFTVLYLYISHQNVFVIGASGAIFGIWAFYSYLTKELKTFFIGFIVFHIIILVMNMPIAWYAHLGGSIVGLLMGYIQAKKKGYLIHKL